VDPSEDWAQRADERKPGALMVYAAVLLGILVLVAALAARMAEGSGDASALLAAIWTALGVGALIVVVQTWQIRRHLIDPLTHLYTWALGMCDGDLSSRIPPEQTGRFAKLTFHINRLSEALERLANEMDDMVWQQTRRMHQRNKSLELLFEVASTINATGSPHEVLVQSAERIMPLVGGTGCVARLWADAEEARVLDVQATLGDSDEGPFDEPVIEEIGIMLDGEHRDQQVTTVAVEHGDTPYFVVTVPMHYQGRNLGCLNFRAPEPDAADDEELRKLLLSVGKHLGMALAKARLDQESHDLTLMRERTSLAHELHDSLAQSLAGLRFQVKLLGETLDGEDALRARRELRRITSSLDGLNTELRELIGNFRAPMDERGLLPALEDLVRRFGRSSGISTHLHTECHQLRLPPAAEMQVLGIVREALTNARKHSQANTVRVLVRCEDEHDYTLLVEDDGIGTAMPTPEAENPGEHVGLRIMEERANRLGSDLRIESEPGEGTRIELKFSVNRDRPAVETRTNVR
jgi:two-component system nitrate/nitrite sensor histidine kinase NarX